jgi:phosphopantetheine--protein transferase-like protein
VDLEFNMSHADGCVLVAVSTERAVGVDVEQIYELPEAAALASRFFNAGEAASVASARSRYQSELFLRYWTCKESYLKATGTGLTVPLDSVEIYLPRVRMRRAHTPSPWFLAELRPTSRHVGALAVAPSVGTHGRRAGPRRPRLRLWDWRAPKMLPVDRRRQPATRENAPTPTTHPARPQPGFHPGHASGAGLSLPPLCRDSE